MNIFSRLRKKETAKEVVQKPAVSSDTHAPAIVTEKTKKGNAWRVLLRPLISEKATHGSAQHQYTFIVEKDVTKIDVRRAIEETYGVHPRKVTTGWIRGKTVRSGRSQGRTKTMKKAMVMLPHDKKIQVYEGV